MTTLIWVLVIIGVIVIVPSIRNASWRPVIAEVAEHHTLQVQSTPLLREPTAQGTLDGLPVTIDLQSFDVGDEPTKHTCIEMSVPMPEGLSLQPGSTFERRFADADFDVGDPSFDARVAVRGPEWQVRALLDREARAALRAGGAGRIVVEDGRVKWAIEGRADAQTMMAALAKVREIAGLLSRPVTDAALALVVRTDEPKVAAEALRVMPAGPERAALDAQLIVSRSDRLALIAAKRIGHDAVPCARRVLDDPQNPDALRADALTWLARHIDATALAHTCLPRPAIAIAALPILEAAEVPVPLERLTRLFESGIESAIPALHAARRHGESAEALLISAVASKNARVALAAVDGLGLVGTPAAVMALRARVETRTADGQLKSAALAAIRSIQARVGAGGGELSVAAANAAGRLSEAKE